MAFTLKNLTESAKNMYEKASEKVEQAAEKVAEKCTEWTGRETTADEVKKAALIAGVAALGVAALGAVAEAGAGAGAEVAGVAGSDTGGFSNDWEGQATRFFAENGSSLNFETLEVDCEGQVYY